MYMVNEKLVVHENLVEPIAKDIEEARRSFNEKKDLRLVLHLVGGVQNKIKNIPEFEDTPENRFATFVVWNIIGQTGGLFQGKTKEWYETNEKNLEKLGVALMDYLNKIKESLEKGSYEDILRLSKEYFFTLIKISEKLTISIE